MSESEYDKFIAFVQKIDPTARLTSSQKEMAKAWFNKQSVYLSHHRSGKATLLDYLIKYRDTVQRKEA